MAGLDQSSKIIIQAVASLTLFVLAKARLAGNTGYLPPAARHAVVTASVVELAAAVASLQRSQSVFVGLSTGRRDSGSR